MDLLGKNVFLEVSRKIHNPVVGQGAKQ
jgi:hypothetical protein